MTYKEQVSLCLNEAYEISWLTTHDHVEATNAAFKALEKHGLCTVETTPNGDGLITNYEFQEEVEIPLDFSTGGLFHQRTFSWDQPA
jgi:hypothetical protein